MEVLTEAEKKRIRQLEELIRKYQDSYYSGEAEITDAEFDLLWDELKELAPESEVLKKIGTNSTSFGSGYDADGFPKALHIMPMGSQEKAANEKEFQEWVNKVIKNELLTDSNKGLTDIFVVQHKLDGASLELQYEKGVLVRAVTRGDGIKGDDITENARRMKGVLKQLDIPFSGGIRGEVIMTKEVWKEKYSDKANCRNAANGLMRRKDGNGCEDLTYISYDASCTDDESFFTDEQKKIDWLLMRGFLAAETKAFSKANEIIKYREEVTKKRDKLPYDIDGLVVKFIITDAEDLKRNRPEKQIAFKFELETAFSILREVVWSESGATYTPIGIVDPVRIAGTTVKRANLNNPDMIRAMGLKIGSVVSVVKRGEIIPKIEGLAPKGAINKDQKEFEAEIILPSVCSVCNTELIDAGTRLYCPNTQCPKRLLHRLEKWIAVLDIRELGEKLIRQLFEKERVLHIHDLYTLTKEELSEYDRMGELSAAKVIRHIMTKRELSLAAFVAGFDLEGIAETTMEKISLFGFDTLEKLRDASKEDIAGVHGLGDITASVIVEGLKECAKEMDSVLKTGVITIKAPVSADNPPMRGLSFCFTGELNSMKRNDAKEKVKALGAEVKSSVVKGLSYLVTNDSASGSSKNKKAAELGINIIDEKQFLELLKTKPETAQNTQGTLF